MTGNQPSRGLTHDGAAAGKFHQPDPTIPTAFLPGWTADALCAEVGTEGFYAEDDIAVSRAAKQICRRCHVRDQCLTTALCHREPYGIWGGQDPAERRALLAATQSFSRHYLCCRPSPPFTLPGHDRTTITLSAQRSQCPGPHANDGTFPNGSPVQVRYPRHRKQAQHGRTGWPWLPATIISQCGPDQWYVRIDVRQLARLSSGKRPPRCTPNGDLQYPCCFRDATEIRTRALQS